MSRFSFSSKRLTVGLLAFSGLFAVGLFAGDESEPSAELDALFLRGYAHHQQHEFDEALDIAKKLVVDRENSADYGLLGDVHFDLGDLENAAVAYQQMVDLRPGIASYLRIAEMRWITGDLDGAIEATALAIRSGSQRQPEHLAWAYCRLSRFILERGDLPSAQAAAQRALDLVPDYSAGLLARGLVLMAQDDFETAIPLLKMAAGKGRDPEILWPLWESYIELGKKDEAKRVENEILLHGIGHDPRGVAVFFSTLGEQSDVCTKVARHELESRQDIYTHDALAWSLFRADPESEESLKLAGLHIAKALASGTSDPRLLLHAGLIAQQSRDSRAAGAHLAAATIARQMLLPSERRLLDAAQSAVSGQVAVD